MRREINMNGGDAMRGCIFRFFALALGCASLLGCAANLVAEPVAAPVATRGFVPSPGSTLSVLTRREADAVLLFLGTTHSFSQANPQLPDIERLLAEFAPTVILIEGGEWTVEATREAAIKQGGEMGFATFLANARGLKPKTFEPNFSDEIAHVLKLASAEDVKLYYALRMVPQFRAQLSAQAMDTQMNTLLSSGELAVPPALHRILRNVDELNRVIAGRFPTMSSWQTLDVHRIGLPVERDGSARLDAIRMHSEAYRNGEMMRAIASNLKSRERVLLIAGTNHLRAYLRATAAQPTRAQ